MKMTVIFILCFIVFSAYAEQVFNTPCAEIQSMTQAQSDPNEVVCHYHYQQIKRPLMRAYNRQNVIKKGSIKVASFNILHPGMTKTRYKDFSIMAKMMNEWDLIGVQELIPSTGSDLANNREILKHLPEKKELIQYYRYPGYFKLLRELQKIDDNWSLIMSIKAEGSVDSDVPEYSGFFYRQNTVKPIVTPYCRNRTKTINAFGCLPTTKDLGDQEKLIFSRRPFMASFKFGEMKMTGLSTHVVFTSSSKPEIMEMILNKLPDDIDGITKDNYARVAEVKLTFDLIKLLENNKLSYPVIYMGDMNLEARGNFWPKLLEILPGYEVTNETLTSLSPRKDSQGLSQNYDHFVFDKEKIHCNGVDHYNFMLPQIPIALDIQKYLLHGLAGKELEAKIEAMKAEWMSPLEKSELPDSFMTVKKGVVVKDTEAIEKYLGSFVPRMIQTQFSDDTYYSIYREILSDHLPITMNCQAI